MPAPRPGRFALIIGAMKCGTTSLFDLLAQHPQVCPCRTKEPDHFTQPGRQLAAYLDLWAWQPQHRVALEASVSYAKLPFFPGVAGRIRAAALGDVRLIYLMRHPLQRIESQARHSQYAGWGKSLDEERHPDLLAYSRYAMQLDEYRRHFAAGQLLPLFLDDLEQRPAWLLRQVCQFLELDPDFTFTDTTTRRNTGELFEALPALAAIGRQRWGRAMLRHALPVGLKTRLRHLLAALARQRPRRDADGPRWRLTSREQAELWAELADDLARLQSDYGLTVPESWRAPAAAPAPAPGARPGGSG